jgi:FecR-like protein
MNDDYLWNRSGPPDPDIQRRERLLGRLQSVPPLPQLPEAGAERSRRREYGLLLAAAAAIVLVVAGWRTMRTPAAWEVASVAGQPRIGSAALAGRGRIAVGETLVTDSASQARINVSTIGEVTVDPDTRVRLVATRHGHHQLALERGTLHALITAPPGQFIVSTRSATATDLGCAYTLHVDEDGTGLLSVTAGWVALTFNGRESLVPAGASSRTHPTLGPGTPWFEDADEEFQDAVYELDFGSDATRRAGALRIVLARAESGHAVTLWHLIRRVDAADRGALVDALADQVAMPPGVTREAVLKLDAAALDEWWNALGLGEAGWWRKFAAPMPGSHQ